MAEAWVYIDESQGPNAAGTEKGQPFWVAALATEQPVSQDVIDGAMTNLRADPDAKGNSFDDETLARGHFHASFDSKNAHSWLCRAIVDSGLNASISASLWYFDRRDSHERTGADLHRLSALLSALSALQDDYDVVHVHAARRDGTFDDADIDAFPAYFRTHTLGALVNMPALPARFPKIESLAASGAIPGIQVCDFVLWAVQRARPDGLDLKGKRDWVKNLKLRLWAAGGAQGAAHQVLDGELGRGAERPYLPPIVAQVTSPRTLDSMKDAALWDLAQDIARDIQRSERVVDGHTRIGHLADLLHGAADGCRRAASAPPVELGSILSNVMEAFLLVNDTLPVYDHLSEPAWSRATEKRRLAAAILLGTRPLWFPDGFALDAVALGI